MLNRGFEAENRIGARLRSNVSVSRAVAPLKGKVGEVRMPGIVALLVRVGAMVQRLSGPQAALPSPQITNHSSGRRVGSGPASPG